MALTLTREQHKLLRKFQKQEITGYHVYRNLAKMQKDLRNRDILNRIAEDEMAHYRTYRHFTGLDIKAGRWEIVKYRLISCLVGPTFTIKLMEKNEANDQLSYSRLSNLPEIVQIIRDEQNHEKELIGMISEERLNYMGSVVLGLNDALVELTGALAGLTFALQHANLIALTGSITGIAAAFSMAASEYLSTKSEDTGKHAVTASVYTGIAYIFTVSALVLPYLLLNNVYLSLAVTLIIAVVIIAVFNYYYSVVRDEKFIRRFGEMALLSMGVALLSFGVGFMMRKFFGIEI
jgi:VIT1/CCC1 family predicted Fe2+/Mn2+ transporter